MPQKKNNVSGIVYSTDNNYRFESDIDLSIPGTPSEQKLHIRLDKKHRGGKMVTIVDGYRGGDIEEIGKSLKKTCGTGGSVKDGVIIIQGDNRDKILAWLLKNGFRDVKKG